MESDSDDYFSSDSPRSITHRTLLTNSPEYWQVIHHRKAQSSESGLHEEQNSKTKKTESNVN